MNRIFQQNLTLLKVGLKKGGRHRIQTPKKRENLTCFGCLNIRTQKFYWKKSIKSGSDSFLWFLTQLRQRTPKKQIAIIPDNTSIHKSRKVKRYLKRHQNIHLFYLPTYSPEYNPVELFWKWIKPKIYGFSALGGIEELISKFRKLVWHYNKGTLHRPIRFNFKAYEKLL